MRNAALSDVHLGILGRESMALEEDLRRQDAKAAVTIREFRASLVEAYTAGRPLPDLPLAVKQLQHGKDVILRVHLTSLESKLGPEASRRLDDYVSHEIAPHIRSRAINAQRDHNPERSPLPSFSIK
jgi:hypothetical protein